MRKPLYSAVVLVSLSTICSAQTITETFGSGVNAFTMDFVTIGNPGNAADNSPRLQQMGMSGYGSVSYAYNLGKYEVSRDAIMKANILGSLGITMYDMTGYGGNGLLKPASGISFYEAAKFVDFLNTFSGNTRAYKFDVNGNFQLWSIGDAGYDPNNQHRNSLAKYFIPTHDEWYKAAFGGLDGTWYAYPTGSNSAPTPVAGGTSADSAVYNQSGPADTINAGGLSAWGTMGQGGNVWEWVETNNLESEQRILRGGSWSFYNSNLESSLYSAADPSTDYENLGFRIAMIPEPSSFSLLALGGVVVALRRRRE